MHSDGRRPQLNIADEAGFVQGTGILQQIQQSTIESYSRLSLDELLGLFQAMTDGIEDEYYRQSFRMHIGELGARDFQQAMEQQGWMGTRKLKPQAPKNKKEAKDLIQIRLQNLRKIKL